LISKKEKCHSFASSELFIAIIKRHLFTFLWLVVREYSLHLDIQLKPEIATYQSIIRLFTDKNVSGLIP
jgi:hypothetical protein